MHIELCRQRHPEAERGFAARELLLEQFMGWPRGSMRQNLVTNGDHTCAWYQEACIQGCKTVSWSATLSLVVAA
jgi:hypothetical protein